MIVEKTTDSGISVIVDRRGYLNSVSVMAGFRVGSRSETAGNSGISHVLEHMAFKGTEDKDEAEIAEWVESAGGVVNAFTGKEMTAFLVRILREDMERGLDLFEDILLRPAFKEKDMQSEKDVIVHEIRSYLDDPAEIAENIVLREAFGGSSLEFPVWGCEENVKGFTACDLREFMKNNYRTGNMAVSAVGDIEPNEFADIVEERFGGKLPPGRGSGWGPAVFKGGDASGKTKKEASNTDLILCFEGPPFEKEHEIPAVLMLNAMGGGFSSRLFKRVRSELGLAYDINPFIESFHGTGICGIRGSSSEPERMLEETARLLRDVAERGFTEEEMRKSRNRLRANAVMNDEKPFETSGRLLREKFSYGRAFGLEEVLDAYTRCPADDVMEKAREIWTGKPVIAWAGPQESLDISAADVAGIIGG